MGALSTPPMAPAVATVGVAESGARKSDEELQRWNPDGGRSRLAWSLWLAPPMRQTSAREGDLPLDRGWGFRVEHC